MAGDLAHDDYVFVLCELELCVGHFQLLYLCSEEDVGGDSMVSRDRFLFCLKVWKMVRMDGLVSFVGGIWMRNGW